LLARPNFRGGCGPCPLACRPSGFTLPCSAHLYPRRWVPSTGPSHRAPKSCGGEAPARPAQRAWARTAPVVQRVSTEGGATERRPAPQGM